MARLSRLALPGYPHHIVQRGNNRQSVFVDRQDYELMLSLLADQAQRWGVAVHSYVLMENHFHLLVTPQTVEGIPKMMQAVGRSYVQAFNRRHGRTGTLWEGRYRSTVLQPERYLLACMAYIDLNPVRAGLVAQAGGYPWSSHGHWLGLRNDRLLTPPSLYWALGNTPFAREAAYAALVQEGVGRAQQSELTRSVLSGWVLGDPGFVENLQKLTERRMVRAQAGRPPKKTVPT